MSGQLKIGTREGVCVMKILTSPCPWCKKHVDITNCMSRSQVRHRLSYGHLYVGGLKPPATRCEVKSAWLVMIKAGRPTPTKEVPMDREEKWIDHAVRKWREQSPNCHLLTDEQLRQAQRPGGLNQSREAKQRGGFNQPVWEKEKGGRKSAEVRWGNKNAKI